MTRRPPRDPSTYDVGYRKPPASSRFKPGVSGNKRGRPKGSRSFGAILRKILDQKIVVTEDGKTRKVSRVQVMFHRIANAALRGDMRAVKVLISLYDSGADLPGGKVDMDILLEEDRAILSQWVEIDDAPDGNAPAPTLDEDH